MILKGILSPILLILISCDPLFFQVRSYGNRLDYKTDSPLTNVSVSPAATAKDAMHAQDSQLVIESLNSGDNVAGSIPAPVVVNDCLLGVIQYKIEVPGGVHKLVIKLQGNHDVDLYVRISSPITKENGMIVADFKSSTPQSTEHLFLPANTPVLERGTYFIGVSNCGPGAADYNLSAQILDPPDAETVGLSPESVEVGSIPAPDPGSCRVGRTQYAAISTFDPCAGSFFLSIRFHADQNVNVYVRKDKRITVGEGSLVMYDSVSGSETKDHSLWLFSDTPGVTLFFVAIENCSFGVANYVVTTSAIIGDTFPPFVRSAFFEKKDLHVVGGFFGSSAIVLLDGEPQQTIFDSESNFPDMLIVKKAKKKIARHQTVSIAVKRSGCTSQPLIFTRP